MKRSVMAAVLLSLVLAFTGSVLAQGNSQPGKGVEVKPAVATWSSAEPLEAIFAALLGDLGYNVQSPKALSNPIFYQSVTQDAVDFWANGWFPLHNAQLPSNFKQNAEVLGTIVSHGAIQGYLVDKKDAEKYNIKSLADFKRPEVRKAFDSTGDGKATLVGCPPGWGCHDVISYQMKAYGLSKYIHVVTAGYAASFADALARYKNGKPILYYTWTPNFTIYKLVPGKDVVWINVPKIDPTKSQKPFEKYMTQKNIKGAVTNPIKMGFVANDIRTVANKKFVNDNPAAKKLLQEVTIPLADISRMTNEINNGQDTKKQVQAMARSWIANHQSEVDQWLSAARQAAAQASAH
ncbi:MAG TPA: glycine betaine/L-proline ABC transporter substrate-binding protein ProX [Trueperaceae bacterium]|nr:glycine betaine/L-proline ABC transporter substrate-binding protein ProX [Trueperaceae bacterium]